MVFGQAMTMADLERRKPRGKKIRHNYPNLNNKKKRKIEAAKNLSKEY